MFESLRWQTLQPDVLLLNISKESYLYDEGVRVVPDWIERFGPTVNWGANTGPYRKLIPALEWAGPEDIVVTLDDDVIVGIEWLRSLVKHAREHEDAIITARGRRMVKTILGGWKNYAEWRLVGGVDKSTEILPIGCAGTLYRRRLIDYDFLVDRAFLSVAPTSDDLWFKMASYMRGVPVVVDPEIDNRCLHIDQGFGLKSVNLGGRGGVRPELLEKIRRNTLVPIKGRLGINDSENDRAWDRICAYAWSRKCRAEGRARRAG